MLYVIDPFNRFKNSTVPNVHRPYFTECIKCILLVYYFTKTMPIHNFGLINVFEKFKVLVVSKFNDLLIYKTTMNPTYSQIPILYHK